MPTKTARKTAKKTARPAKKKSIRRAKLWSRRLPRHRHRQLLLLPSHPPYHRPARHMVIRARTAHRAAARPAQVNALEPVSCNFGSGNRADEIAKENQKESHTLPAVPSLPTASSTTGPCPAQTMRAPSADCTRTTSSAFARSQV